jgi:hypothetical protein
MMHGRRHAVGTEPLVKIGLTRRPWRPPFLIRRRCRTDVTCRNPLEPRVTRAQRRPATRKQASPNTCGTDIGLVTDWAPMSREPLPTTRPRHAAPGRLGRGRDGRAVGVGSGRGALWQRFGEVGAARTAAARAAGGADRGAGGDVAVCEPARTGHSVSTVNRFRGALWQASGEGRAWSTRGRSRAADTALAGAVGVVPGPDAAEWVQVGG